MTGYRTILTEVRGRVGWITLNRPDVLNALNSVLTEEVAAAATAFDADPTIGAIVLTGSERAFAAGADISEVSTTSSMDDFLARSLDAWSRFAAVRTPVVAAVSGFALGGGCELAMMCDIVVAAESARFGQPEIRLGIIPGMGGTQRLVRAVGFAKAADLVLTGRTMDAVEAERAGLVSRVVPDAEVLEVASSIADTIAQNSLPSVYAAKQSLDAALETSLAEGLRVERRAFEALFDTVDQGEGMAAFREKRRPRFEHR